MEAKFVAKSVAACLFLTCVVGTVGRPCTAKLREYSIDVKGSPCQGGDCRQCTWAITAPVKPVKHPEGTGCLISKSHKGYRNCAANPSFGCIGQCMECNGKCMNYSSMVEQYLGKDSPCTEEIDQIGCCTVLHMRQDDYCLNGGILLCKDDKKEPICTCPVGWTESRCDKRMFENVICKCFKTDITLNSFCGINDMYRCDDDDRPENWTECRQNRCVCKKSEVHHSTKSLPECTSNVLLPEASPVKDSVVVACASSLFPAIIAAAAASVVSVALTLLSICLCRLRARRKKKYASDGNVCWTRNRTDVERTRGLELVC
ncbi:neurogenic locus notch homolog protein 1-like isoform X2 [Dreissena polymorpha]|nr:neurogenic locus notch homolog protein 1-like isoform X2 [Dreissena polymorpha]XP_052218740.1 neurogenic locus notch homolog protein 1-like isoform X2 [Dreissena polymorpha]